MWGRGRGFGWQGCRSMSSSAVWLSQPPASTMACRLQERMYVGKGKGFLNHHTVVLPPVSPEKGLLVVRKVIRSFQV